MRFWLLFVFLWTSVLFPQEDFGGLYFPGKKVYDYYRTSVQLNNDNPFDIHKSLILQFDVSFWSSNYMGMLASGKSDEFNFQIIFNNYRNSDTAFIEFIARQSILVEIPLAKKSLIRNQWHSLKLELNVLSSFLKFTFNDNTIFRKFVFPPINNMQLSLGTTTETNDILEGAIRNIHLKLEDDYYFWDLKNSDRDIYHKAAAKISYPHWLSEKHRYWEKRVSANAQDFNKTYSVYNPDADSLYIFHDKYFFKISILDFKYDSIPYLSGEAYKDYYFLYDPINKNIKSYYKGGEGSVRTFQNNQWPKVDTSFDHEQRYYVHSYFFNPYSGDLMTLGGYGLYKFKNDLRRYDYKKKSWQKVETTGDYLEPRELSSHSQVVDGKIYFYGGKGSETGEQDLKLNFYTEVFTLDPKDYKIQKLFKLEGQFWNEDDQYTNFCFFSAQDSSIYFAHRRHDSLETHIFLDRISLTERKIYRACEEKIFPGEVKLLDFFFSEKTKEFFIVVGSNQKAEVYSILYPPLNKVNKTTASGFSYWLIPAIAVILSGLLLILLKRKKPEKQPDLRPEEKNNVGQTQYLNLFGSFYITDKHGNDFSGSFSPKLKQLFVLILINSRQINGFNGITTEKITNVLWPDSSPESAKNTRGVTVNNLRKLLDKIGGLNLVNENNRWDIVFKEENFFFDLGYYINNKRNLSDEIDEKILKAFSRGEFLKDFDYEWIESYKLHISMEVLSTLLSALKKETDLQRKTNIAEAVTSIDSLNEEGAISLISCLISKGKISLAKQKYEAFTSEYLRVFEKKYPKNFSDLLKN